MEFSVQLDSLVNTTLQTQSLMNKCLFIIIMNKCISFIFLNTLPVNGYGV